MASSRTPLAALEADVRGVADVEGFGLVLPNGDGDLSLHTRHRSGTTSHVFPIALVPPVLRPPDASAPIVVRVSALDNPQHVFMERIRQYGIQTLVSVPLRRGPGVFWAGVAQATTFSPAELAAFDALADGVAAAHRADESFEMRLARLRRLEAADRMLPVLGGALDVRDVFPQLSAIAKSAIAHDLATLQLLDDDLVRARLYALEGVRSDVVPQAFPTQYSAVFNNHFRYAIHDDVLASPIERERPAALAGMRSALRLPLNLGGRVAGAIEFSATRVGAYTEADVPIARRIGDYVAVAIGHQRMADAAVRSAAMKERAQNVLALEELLPALAGVIDVREVFDRVSAIAKHVIPHDALGLPLLSDDREHIIPFATVGVPAGTFPPMQPVPPIVRHLFTTTTWDHEIFDDLQPSIPGQATYARMGHKSVLRVPIRVEGQPAGALVFLSRTPHTYSQQDVNIAKRIADHIALALSHQRLAEKARRTEELRARAARLELLDELLASVTGSGELPDVFGRVSEVAKKVLEHDALVLTAVNPDGVTAKVYAHQAPETARFPDIVEVPPYMLANPDWEHELIDDLQELPNQRHLAAGRLGYRSALRVSIRLDGQYVAGVSFLSMTPAFYTPACVVVARRIADRLALNFARERRAAAAKRADEATARVTELELRVRELTDELDARTGYRRVVGDSPAWRQVLTQATQVASTETTVLLLGESGTGKEVVARFIHRGSARQDGPFVALNCAALPEQLLEAELFGYERGAFTGATQSKPGQLEQAGGGTLFLDEVGEMSPPAQAKFLRVLQEREFQRLGGTRVLRTDARIIAATNRNLPRAIEQGTFREDLFYRLNVFAINLPPLRVRCEDVLPLCDAFLAEYARSLGRPPAGISRDARKRLLEYDWPGNVRELRNILERAAILSDGGLITAEHLNLDMARTPSAAAASPAVASSSVAAAARDTAASAPPPTSDLASMEKAMVIQALEKHRYNKSKAATELGLTRAQLYVRMKKHGLE